MVILLCYTSSAFSEVIYADFYAKILDWNFRLIDENSQILVIVFVSKLNFSFSFRFINENCGISLSLSLRRKLIYFRQQKFSFSSSSTKKTLLCKMQAPIRTHCIGFYWNLTLSIQFIILKTSIKSPRSCLCCNVNKPNFASMSSYYAVYARNLVIGSCTRRSGRICCLPIVLTAALLTLSRNIPRLNLNRKL